MEIIEFNYDNTPENKENIVLLLGYFDAIHLGHQLMVNKAKEFNMKIAVMSFDQPPSFVLKKAISNLSLTSTADKAEIFESLGVDYFYILHFDKEVSELTRFEFVEKVLQKINPKMIICGEDYRFGNLGSGTPNYLKQFFDVTVVDLLFDGSNKISSRDIATLVKERKVKEAGRLMGRNYRVFGIVKHGLGNGRKLGFPTANIELDYPYILPGEGVYLGYGVLEDKKYPAIIDIGRHPTFRELQFPRLEVHFLDFDKNLYGQYVYVEFVDYIRDNIQFYTPEELSAQLEKDKAYALEYFKIK